MTQDSKRKAEGSTKPHPKKQKISEQTQHTDDMESVDTLSDSTPAPNSGAEGAPTDNNANVPDKSSTIRESTSRTSTVSRYPRMTATLNTKDMKHLGPELIKRITAIANYTNDSSRTYAFDMLPVDTTWGVRPTFSESSSASKTVCLKGTQNACLVWFVGRISKLWFFNSNNEPLSPVKISIEPWSVGTTTKLRKKLKSLSQPPQESVADDSTLVRASKIMATRDGPADYFVECYDARTVLKSKNQMQTFEVNDLGMRDTVVIECNISRVWNKLEKKAAPSWYGFLQLKAIYLIHKDVSDIQEDTEADEAPEDEGLSL